MADHKRTVLITGCSDGGMGSELAKEFHRAGLHVYATARNSSKLEGLTSLGIETLLLDITSEASIEQCLKKVPSLDILINNAGASYTMPVSDISIPEAKKLFDLNLWGHIAVTQAFLPLLLKSPNPFVVNHTSVGAGLTIPWQATYNASKAAFATYSDTLRLELKPFGVTVIELRTAGVKTNIINNIQAKQPALPESSIFSPAKELVDKALSSEWARGSGIPAGQWAKEVVADLLKKSPPSVIWRGESAFMVRIFSVLPFGSFDGMISKLTGLDKVASVIQKR